MCRLVLAFADHLYDQYLHFTVHIFIDFLLTVKAATLIFISGRGSAVSPTIYNLVKI